MLFALRAPAFDRLACENKREVIGDISRIAEYEKEEGGLRNLGLRLRMLLLVGRGEFGERRCETTRDDAGTIFHWLSYDSASSVSWPMCFCSFGARKRRRRVINSSV